VKQWRRVVRALDAGDTVLVTHHGQPEAVIMPPDAYAELVGKAEGAFAAELEALSRRFDDRLAALRREGAGDRLRSVMDRGAKLGGKLRAGSGY
jgi:antitoxin (DNA-binding transcriptional repressor) of toxin-antitoxin stability system